MTFNYFEMALVMPLRKMLIFLLRLETAREEVFQAKNR